ncbi:TetR/AcrR family transcriptional regulator [Streptomyces sp. NBC_01142]|uniref:TetR/AcrR family transcriptional regulator n=1 Tax=Streptomyces sp. NBC_01142 TaxID=2975865 RepID=UPI00224D7362|nr:TetR/AcrR family transcriptional regulator [Streptomyces sp. NBC_01142]MCX4822362.1 TetR/AcrR family transcriptional regulator [Streptomyces sp. NBC_01142]
MSAQPLREQKKKQTRQAISDAATGLFIERGFDRVTIADVAAAAGVAKMTVTNYFPRKEDLVLDLSEAFVSGPARVVAARPAGVSPLEALRDDYLAAVRKQDPVIGFSGEPFARMIVDSPVLLARLREFHEQREAALAEQLGAEAGARAGTGGAWGDPQAPKDAEDPEGITCRAVAAQLGAALRVLFGCLLERTLTGGSNAEIAAPHEAEARRVFELLEPSLARCCPVDRA